MGILAAASLLLPRHARVTVSFALRMRLQPGWGAADHSRPSRLRAIFLQPGRRILDFPGGYPPARRPSRHPGICSSRPLRWRAVCGACAYALPERVTAAFISSAGPVEAPEATLGMSALIRPVSPTGAICPGRSGVCLSGPSIIVNATILPPSLQRETGHRPTADEQQINRPEVREACLQVRSGSVPPGPAGFAWDARLLTSPWGFSLDKIKIPVYLWHGTADDLTSLSMARYMADQISNARLTICENEAHLLLFPHWEEILTQLISE